MKYKFYISIFSSIFLFILTLFLSNNIYAQTPSLTFEPSTLNVDLNEVFDVEVIVDTAGEDVGGTGAIVNYNPQYLQVVKPTEDDLGVTPGSIFSDYPRASFDNTTGEIILSGVITTPGELYVGRGSLGSIKFMAVRSGDTTVTYEFTPGSTTDSNIAVSHGNGDILESVSDLEVNISQQQAANAVVIPSPPANSASDVQEVGIIDRVLRFFRTMLGIEETPEIDPYEPVSNLPPNTAANRTQPSPASDGLGASNLLLIAILIVVTILVIILVRYLLLKRKSNEPTVVQKDIEL